MKHISSVLKRKVKVENIIFFVLLFPFIQPRNWESRPELKNIYNLYSAIASVIILAIWCIYYMKRKENSKLIFFIVSYYSIYIISTFLNSHENIKNTLFNCICTISFLMLVDIWAKRDFKVLLKTLVVLFSTFIIINFILMEFLPGTLFRREFDKHLVYFLGEKNSLSFFIIPAVSCIIAYYHEYHKKIKKLGIILIFVAIYELFRTGSAGSIVALLSGMILMIMNKLKFKINVYHFMLLYIIMFILLVFVQNSAYYSYFIHDILGKSLTFSDRTTLWNQSLDMIKKFPWLGQGGYFINRCRFLYHSGYYSSHNALLQSAVDAGIISIVFFCMNMKIACKELHKNREKQIAQDIIIGIICIMLTFLIEAFTFKYLYMLLVLGVNIKKLNIKTVLEK
ncbi:O-antigen ligase [uncultured Clostridium sp.]|uniref:O-antigen ligase family protein n=1 Tax=uncultured Clostridium sp. TaxID=59620 RepID=UPI0025FD391D|nr:O-antigen ligase family protein [uncultured Clostridium sp.]